MIAWEVAPAKSADRAVLLDELAGGDVDVQARGWQFGRDDGSDPTGAKASSVEQLPLTGTFQLRSPEAGMARPTFAV